MTDFKDDLFHISNVPFWAIKGIVFTTLSGLFYQLIVSDPGNTVAISIVLALVGSYVTTAIIFNVGNCIIEAIQLRYNRSRRARQKLIKHNSAPRWYKRVEKHSPMDLVR